MVGSGFHLDLKSSSHVSHSYFFIIGLILAYDSTLTSHVQASPPVSCKSMNISLKYQHCGIHPDGVHDLDCFGKKISPSKKTCVWKPGNHGKTHTLIIQQHTPTTRNRCKVHINITNMSEEVKVSDKYNMTVQVFENSESTNCTKAVFRGSPNSLLRCGPPDNASFSRHTGRLAVNVSWEQEDRRAVEFYSVRYKALGSLSWSESGTRCHIGKEYTVENLNPSLVYSVQIQCVTNNQCTQCPWSEVYTVPSELTVQPVIVTLDDTNIAERPGTRLLSLTWKFPAEEPHDGFYVTVGKASGEAPRERMNATHPEIRLILSHSAYHLNISAFNNASTSPPLREIIPQRNDQLTGKVDVKVHSNTSFTIYWRDDLIKKYVCYSAEWMTEGRKAVYKSFYENKNNYRTLSPLPAPLEPYKRYSITLHRRPNKDTCNMKRINNSESTYGRTQFYFIEGSPVSAPTDINSDNATLDSLVLQWSSIPEEDVRGFLLGYVIYYSEYQHRGIENVTVDPLENSYELTGLKSGTAYTIQIAGFTRAGEGERSQASLFKTKSQGYFNMNSIIIISAVVAFVLIFGTPLIKRGKAILWPSIPNPGNSNAMQKIERPCEVELLEPINTLKAEEWDTNTLQIVAKEDVNPPASTLPSILPLLHASVDEDDSVQMTFNWIQRDIEDPSGDIPPDITAETIPDIQRTDPQTLAFPSGYTTMEMFQQGALQPTNTSVTEEGKPGETDFTVVKAGQDYVRQIIASPMLDNESMTTIL